jgi:uncharacterized membrane protein YgcG
VRQHWAVILSPLLQSVAAVFLLILAERNLPAGEFVDNLTFYTALVIVLRFAFIVALWWVERVVITDKRVLRSQGIITHKIGMMPLGKVTDLTYERTLTGRTLGYGHLIIESAGQAQAFDRINFLPKPYEVYEAISQLVFGEKGSKPPPKPPPSPADAAGPGPGSGGGGPGDGGPGGGGPRGGGDGGGPAGGAGGGDGARPTVRPVQVPKGRSGMLPPPRRR